MAWQVYRPPSDTVRGLSVSVEVKGDIMVATGDIMTRSEEAIRDPPNSHSTSTVTSLSTASGSVTVQVRVWLVPSYRGPLERESSTRGVETTQEKGKEKVSLEVRCGRQNVLTADGDIGGRGGGGHRSIWCWCVHRPLTGVLSSM